MNNAGQLLIVINRIHKKGFCLYNISYMCEHGIFIMYDIYNLQML